MAKVDKLVLRAITPPFLISLTALTFIVCIRELGRLSELLVTHNASLAIIAFVAAIILPPILIFSLPMSFLIGILIGLSGLSGESQIIALRACGIPLRRLLRPTLALGAVVWLATTLISVFILPRTNDWLHFMKDKISVRQAAAHIEPRVFNEDFGNLVFYLEDLALDRQKWSRVFVVDNTNPKTPRMVLAREGSWVTDNARQQSLQLHLVHGTVYEVDPDDPSKDNVSLFESTDIPVDFGSNSPGPGTDAQEHHNKKTAEEETLALWSTASGMSPTDRRERLLEFHKRLALPFSVVGFALLGLTLGINAGKGGRASGFVLSFVLVLAFYNLFMNGQRLAGVGTIPVWLGAWGADIVLTAIGILLLATAERTTGMVHAISGWLWRRPEPLEPVTIAAAASESTATSAELEETPARSTPIIARVRFPKIVDLYVARGFFLYFVASTAVCTALFIILTLFDLLDDIIKNRIALAQVVDYFVFLTPQILQLVVPMAILLAVLINFAILEKSSQVTALKAGGWSLYRIAVPVFLLAGAGSASLYVLQDYVLPYANIRQDGLRHVIKGRPPQTSMRPQRKWIFGESNRVFNYDYFDPGRRMFVGLNVIELDLERQQIHRRIHASRAWIGDQGNWMLESGWLRDFNPTGAGFSLFTRTQLTFPEKPGYFEKEIFEPRESSKLTYLELKDYIDALRKSGYNATQLQVELYKKISFPVSCLVMALVGVPFSFSMGRKGAFVGIGVSIAVAMAYWGIFSLFEQMGTYGLLVPLLAAWAPNILFGATGLFLLFTIRT